ncbi:unnamed protein product [Adineta steineri]|uniref:ADP ribosyltransferase domain-containing protein n=1 Tax=Adineta steineri TaxID=433720 RepID=A0A818LXG7_9BILA|nr:unnamed protein product [Adineta steineri]CAF3585679.1 unnamed protein product [Adineta steineri]
MATSKSSVTKKINPTSDLSTCITANRRTNIQRMQNVLLIWLDNNIDDDNADYNNTIKQLKRVVNDVNTYTDGEECIEFIQTITNNKVRMIISGSLGQHIVPHVHKMSQVDTIFIFCNNQEWYKQWAKEWPKIRGVFTDTTSICEALKQASQQCEQNAISISFMASLSNKKLNQLDPSFMYTQILKEILLTIDFEDKHFEEFITYCRDAFVENEYDLQNIEKLERDYHDRTPVWWYTYQCFLYSMLNSALRQMDVGMIIRMGFFIKDLHRDIQRLHSEQFDGHQLGKPFTVYRGQCLSKEDFTEMTKTKGGLLSFNNFLSTSKNRDVSLFFAPQAATNSDLVGILFVMSINPMDSTTPFASVSDVSYFHTEDEVLFSMHTIFRVGDIKPMDGNNHLYNVHLTLTNDNEQNLRTLTNSIRQEIFSDSKGWCGLGLLLIKMSQFDKAEEVYEVLLHEATNESDKANIYDQLGSIKYSQRKYQKALSSYEKALAIRQQSLLPNHPDMAKSYYNIGNVHFNMGGYTKALSSLEKALVIRQQSLPPNHPDLAKSYHTIGNMYGDMGDYPKALSSHEKALVTKQQSLSSNHPDLDDSCINIGLVHYNMGDYPKAISYYEKALAIRQQSLPFNHSDLALSYKNIGLVCNTMGDYLKALSFQEKALAINQLSLPSNHPDFGDSYNNIGLVYYYMGDYKKALSSHEKALATRQQSLSSNHPDLALSYNNIGLVYTCIGDYSKALSSLEKALEIQQQSLPSNHPDLSASHNNIGLVYYCMDDYTKALSSHEKALAIKQQSLPSTHPDLALSYNNIGLVYNCIGDYSKALSFQEKALAIIQQSLPSNHPTLGASYNSIGLVYKNMGNYSKAHSLYERAEQIAQQSLPTNHPDLKMYRQNLEDMKKKL